MEIEGLDKNNISSVLAAWKIVEEQKQDYQDIQDWLEVTIKNFLKQRNWDRYNDTKTKTSVSLEMVRDEKIDRKHLDEVLTDNQKAQIFHARTKEKLIVMTAEKRKLLSKAIKAR